MFKRNPESPNVLPPTTESPQSQEAAAREATEKRFETFLKRRRRMQTLSKAALGTALFTQAHVSLYLGDVRINMMEAENASPSVIKLADAIDPANNDSAAVFLHGFKTSGARHLIETLGEGYQQAFDGKLFYLQYNNASLDAETIGEIVEEKLDTEGVDKVKVVAYSQAGDPAIRVVVDNIIANTTAAAEDVTFISSMANYDTLTEKTKQELLLANYLTWIPFIEHSTPASLALEAVFYQKAMQKAPLATSGEIGARYANGDVSRIDFLISQIYSITDSDIPGKINEIQDYAASKHQPNINYISIEENGKSGDVVVNNKKSSEEIKAAAEEAGLNFTEVSVKSQHGQYYKPNSVQEYTRAFAELAEIVEPYTAEETKRVALNRYGHYPNDGIPPNR